MSRTYYRSKEAWAKARVAELEATIREIRYSPTAEYSHARYRKRDQLHSLRQQLAKFQRLAARYELTGQ